MKTVVLSSNTSWYLYNFRMSTLRALVGKGYRVVCLAPEDEYSQRLESELKCKWLPLKMDNQGNNPFRDAALIFQFWRYYREIKPVAACHFTIKNNVYGTWAARANRIPAINNIPGLGTAFMRKGPVSAIVRLLYKTSQGFAQTVFCQNEDDLKQLRDHGLVPADRLKLIPGSGVDLNRYRPALHRVLNDRPFLFLYAGRMLLDKGLRELRQAMQILNDNGHRCRLWLCGFANVENVSAMSESQLTEWAEEPYIEWLGPSDRMEDIYNEIDCVVLPSYREGIPRSLLEAGAMAIPVITTNTPGCRTVVTDGYNGFLCEAKNVRSLAEAMEKMMSISQAERTLLGKNGRDHVETKYNETLVVDATIQAIESAIKLNVSDRHGNPQR